MYIRKDQSMAVTNMFPLCAYKTKIYKRYVIIYYIYIMEYITTIKYNILWVVEFIYKLSFCPTYIHTSHKENGAVTLIWTIYTTIYLYTYDKVLCSVYSCYFLLDNLFKSIFLHFSPNLIRFSYFYIVSSPFRVFVLNKILVYTRW